MYMNLPQSYFPEWYREIENPGDLLTGISYRIDFGRVRPILSDPQVEREIKDRIIIHEFPGMS